MHPFTRDPRASVAALGEQRLIALIRRWLGAVSPRSPFGIGDDCAVLPAGAAPRLVTVDPVIYPRHFDDAVAPRDAGAKLLKRNLSDLAAMGGRPTAAVLALMLPPQTDRRWLEQFYRGLAACARRHRVKVVGGDVAQSDATLAASLTLLGTLAGARAVTRRGAARGDAIYVTGRLGGSLASGHHFRFTPRLAEGAWLAGRPEVRAMMDLSDGLAKDLHALTPAGCLAAVEAASLPLRRGAGIDGALGDGEDYELLFAVHRGADAAALQRDWRRRFPRTPLTRIGEFVPAGRPLPAGSVDLSRHHGYEHLR